MCFIMKGRTKTVTGVVTNDGFWIIESKMNYDALL